MLLLLHHRFHLIIPAPHETSEQRSREPLGEIALAPWRPDGGRQLVNAWAPPPPSHRSTTTPGCLIHSAARWCGRACASARTCSLVRSDFFWLYFITAVATRCLPGPSAGSLGAGVGARSRNLSALRAARPVRITFGHPPPPLPRNALVFRVGVEAGALSPPLIQKMTAPPPPPMPLLPPSPSRCLCCCPCRRRRCRRCRRRAPPLVAAERQL